MGRLRKGAPLAADWGLGSKGVCVLAEARKRAISLRLGPADLRGIKKLATRLGVSESDVVRFALKGMLHRMLPLCDQQVRGRSLVPLLADWGAEAVRHFELDVTALDEIVNGDALPDDRVDTEDLALLAAVSTQESYAKVSLRALLPPSRPPATGDRRDDSPLNALRRHLYDKYILPSDPSTGAAPANGSTHAERTQLQRGQA